jgi:hypothetical protein
MLLAKVAVGGVESLSLDDRAVLYYSWTSLEAVRDPTWSKAYAPWYIQVSGLVELLGRYFEDKPKELAPSAIQDLARWYQEKKFLPSSHAYFGWTNLNKIQSFLRQRNRESERYRTRPKRFVGVGYKDSGSRKDVAFDASPSWQEVASHGRITESSRSVVQDPELHYLSYLPGMFSV